MLKQEIKQVFEAQNILNTKRQVNMTLPKQVTIQESVFNATDIEAIADVVSDYLSDTYGFCHKGFDLEIKS